MRFKNLFQLAVTGLAIVASKADVLADQKNITQVELLPVGLDGDQCNVGGSIYTDCQSQTVGLPSAEFTDCMEKNGDYSTRSGDKCCPSPDVSKKFVDCEPNVGGGGMTAAQKGGISAGIILVGLGLLYGARKAYLEFIDRPRQHEVQGLFQGINQQAQNPLLQDDVEQGAQAGALGF